MRVRARLLSALLLSVTATILSAQPPLLGPAERIADGVVLYRLGDPGLLDPPGPVAVQALRLDPGKVTLEMGLAEGHVPARETVQAIAARRGAIAAVNASFFSLADGTPVALLKAGGELLHGTDRPRGAVGVVDRGGRTRLLFDRVTVKLPNHRKVNSIYRPLLGSSRKDWSRAADAVSGAGLLMLDGRALGDWTVEKISAGFDTTRHPRTLIGVDGGGAIWLVTIDGRNAETSLGMSFVEMQGLARRLGLRSALNLDGGGSTTMVAGGTIVNHPSDAAGPRKVSDAILVVPRKD